MLRVSPSSSLPKIFGIVILIFLDLGNTAFTIILLHFCKTPTEIKGNWGNMLNQIWLSDQNRS